MDGRLLKALLVWLFWLLSSDSSSLHAGPEWSLIEHSVWTQSTLIKLCLVRSAHNRTGRSSRVESHFPSSSIVNSITERTWLAIPSHRKPVISETFRIPVAKVAAINLQSDSSKGFRVRVEKTFRSCPFAFLIRCEKSQLRVFSHYTWSNTFFPREKSEELGRRWYQIFVCFAFLPPSLLSARFRLRHSAINRDEIVQLNDCSEYFHAGDICSRERRWNRLGN